MSLVSLISTDTINLLGDLNYEGIRNYTGAAESLRCTGRLSVGDGGEGLFIRSTGTEPDDSGVYLKDSAGRTWRRVFNGPVKAAWYGVVADAVSDNTSAINSALSGAAGLTLEFPRGVIRTTGNHAIPAGTTLLGYGTTFKGTVVAVSGESECFTVNADFVTIKGITIDGESRNPGERYPVMAVGVRVGRNVLASNLLVEDCRFLGSVYGLWITKAAYSVISKCYAYRNGDGFRIASNTSGVLDAVGVSELLFDACVSKENGWTYLPTDGSVFTTSSCGYKITDVAIKNVTYRDCLAEGNCAHGFDYHGHIYSTVPAGFVQEGIRYVRCMALNNNAPEQYFPVGQTAPSGVCTGFYFGAAGVTVNNITLTDCISYGHAGEAVFSTSIDNVELVNGLEVRNLAVEGRARYTNTGVRATNSIVRFNRVRNLTIADMPLRKVAGLYDFIIYGQSLSGTVQIHGEWDVSAPLLGYFQAVNAGTKCIFKDITYSCGSVLNSATEAVGLRLIDFTHVLVQGCNLTNASSSNFAYMIVQQPTLIGTTASKFIDNYISGGTAGATVGIETRTAGGSKLFSGNTVQQCTNGFSAAGGENSIVTQNHFVSGTVTTPLLNFAASTIKGLNYPTSV